MTNESLTFRNNKFQINFKYFVLLLLSNVAVCNSYPLFGENRYLRTVPIRRSAYYSIPVTHHRNEFQLADYDDSYLSTPSEDYEYSIYDKYPLPSYYEYNPNRNYYYDKMGRRGLDSGFEYYDDQIFQNPVDSYQSQTIHQINPSSFPREQKSWYEDNLPKYDKNADVNADFLQNLIMSQMYRDANDPYSYDSSDDYDDQHWSYGVPTTKVEDKEKVRQYFKNKEDEEVKELEMLTRKKEKSKKLKGKETPKKQVAENLAKSKSKMTDDEYFDMQKQIIVKNRKNNYVPAESFRINKKQLYDPMDLRNNFWEYYRFNPNNYPETATSSIKKLNNYNVKTPKAFSISEADMESATISSTASPKRSASAGQKEVVLPRPSNSVRRPFNEVSTRSLHQPTVYDTIKKLLNMEKDASSNPKSQPQKRFIVNEDQLASELSGLKKTSN